MAKIIVEMDFDFDFDGFDELSEAEKLDAIKTVFDYGAEYTNSEIKVDSISIND